MMNFYGTETSSHTCELLKYAFMIISASWGTLLITPFSLIKKAPCDYAENYALIYTKSWWLRNLRILHFAIIIMTLSFHSHYHHHQRERQNYYSETFFMISSFKNFSHKKNIIFCQSTFIIASKIIKFYCQFFFYDSSLNLFNDIPWRILSQI